MEISTTNTLVVLCDRQNDHKNLRKLIQQDENVEELNVYSRPAGLLEFSVTYKDDESARAAKDKLERLAADYWDYSHTVSQKNTVRTTGTETEPSKLLAIQAVAVGPKTAETKATDIEKPLGYDHVQLQLALKSPS